MMDRRDAIKTFFGLSAATTITRIPADILQPDDVIVLSAPGTISEQTAKLLQKYAKDIFPNHKIVVLGDGLTLRVVSHRGE